MAGSGLGGRLRGRRTRGRGRPRRGAGLLAGGERLATAAVDRLLLDRREPAPVVGDDQQVLELVEVRRGLEIGGLDDVVRVALDVDDLPDEKALGERRSDAAAE